MKHVSLQTDLNLLLYTMLDVEYSRTREDASILISSAIGTNWLIRLDADVHLNHNIHALLVLHCLYFFNILK